ncbi:hypothetical protein AB1Y20_007100 [Prymnesium parvum]|uniref:Uncharacterized protein n=1 Tax=Prymnesium parvum TaxID=97485 RepID=A0AB34J2P0_PRYPA
MMSSLDSMLSHFFALLEAWEFSRASYVAERISSRGSSRRISLALQHLVTCESLYLSMRFLDSRNAGLERRIDECASELEACLAALSSTAEAADALYAPADSALCGALQQLVACHFPPADEGGRAAVSGAHVGAMEETVLLLRHVRKPMLHVYISLAGGALSPDGCGRLAEHVGAIREAHARRPSGALPRGVRGATLVELGAAQQLLLAHATLPLLRPREALLALAISHTELGRLRTAERGEAHERALLVVTNASSLGSGLGSRTGPQVASSHAASVLSLLSAIHLAVPPCCPSCLPSISPCLRAVPLVCHPSRRASVLSLLSAIHLAVPPCCPCCLPSISPCLRAVPLVCHASRRASVLSLLSAIHLAVPPCCPSSLPSISPCLRAVPVVCHRSRRASVLSLLSAIHLAVPPCCPSCLPSISPCLRAVPLVCHPSRRASVLSLLSAMHLAVPPCCPSCLPSISPCLRAVPLVCHPSHRASVLSLLSAIHLAVPPCCPCCLPSISPCLRAVPLVCHPSRRASVLSLLSAIHLAVPPCCPSCLPSISPCLRAVPLVCEDTALHLPCLPPQVASSKASSEPPLFRFLRAFCAALVAKAALYFQRLFEPAKLHAALAAEPSAYARRLAAFALSSAPLMAALLFHPKGLHVRTAAGGGVYTCHEAEARLWGGGGGGGGGGEGAPWPVLCLEPAGAPLPQLWPTLKRLMAERQTLLHLSDAYVPPLAVPAVGECTFWLATYDPRVVLVLAFAGRRRANDRAVLEFLRAFADLRGLPARAALEARRE